MKLQYTLKVNGEGTTSETPSADIFAALSHVQSWIEDLTGLSLFIQTQPHFDRLIARLSHTGRLEIFSLEHQLRIELTMTWVKVDEPQREAVQSSQSTHDFPNNELIECPKCHHRFDLFG